MAPPLQFPPEVQVRMKLWPIFVTALTLLAQGAWGERAAHEGEGSFSLSPRAVQQNSARALENAVSACLAGRSFNPATLRSPAARPTPPSGIYGLLPSLPFTELPEGTTPKTEPKDNEFFKGCMESIPRPTNDACITVLASCRAETVDAGTLPITPIQVDSGTPCSAKIAFFEAACAQGLAPDRFSESDLKCGATQSAEK